MMPTHASNTPEPKSEAVAEVTRRTATADSAIQFKDNRPETTAQRIMKQVASNRRTPQVVDNRPEAVAQRKLIDTMNSSTRSNVGNQPVSQLQKMADVPPASTDTPIQKKENNTGLPDNLKSGIENLSGYSMDDVKVHYNSDKPAQLQAHAYAQGTNIHLGPGQEKHLAHEAWHVVQQKQGRVQATRQLKGKIQLNDDSRLEKEADIMGAKALQMKASNADHTDSQADGGNLAGIGSSNMEVVQRAINLAHTVQNTLNIATMRAARDETSGFTPPVVNGTEYAPGAAANWVENNFLAPTITTVQGEDGIYRATVTAVQANTLGYNMYLPTAPPWNAVAPKAATLSYYGVPPMDGNGNVNLVVEGDPNNATFLQQVRAHEDVHAADIDRAITQILVPWDNALQQMMNNGTEFQGETQAAAELALWNAVGGDVAQVCGNLDAQWTADNNAYHASHAGGSHADGVYDDATNTVTFRVSIHQPLAQGANWLGLGTIVVAVLVIGGFILHSLSSD